MTIGALDHVPTKRNNNKINCQWQMHEAQTERSSKMLLASTNEMDFVYEMSETTRLNKQLPRPVDIIG